jgi:hypothetical protein
VEACSVLSQHSQQVVVVSLGNQPSQQVEACLVLSNLLQEEDYLEELHLLRNHQEAVSLELQLNLLVEVACSEPNPLQAEEDYLVHKLSQLQLEEAYLVDQHNQLPEEAYLELSLQQVEEDYLELSQNQQVEVSLEHQHNLQPEEACLEHRLNPQLVEDYLELSQNQQVEVSLEHQPNLQLVEAYSEPSLPQVEEDYLVVHKLVQLEEAYSELNLLLEAAYSVNNQQVKECNNLANSACNNQLVVVSSANQQINKVWVACYKEEL